jgi:hypothetical protein
VQTLPSNYFHSVDFLVEAGFCDAIWSFDLYEGGVNARFCLSFQASSKDGQPIAVVVLTSHYGLKFSPCGAHDELKS